MHDFLGFMFGFMLLFKSCVEVVFGMSIETLTSDQFHTSSCKFQQLCFVRSHFFVCAQHIRSVMLLNHQVGSGPS